MKTAALIAVLAYCSLASAFVAPSANLVNLRLRGSSPALSLGSSAMRRKGRAQIAMMVTPEEEARFRAAEDAEIARKRAEAAEMEKRYYKENSGLGYRRNEQDGLIFVMGNCSFPSLLHTTLWWLLAFVSCLPHPFCLPCCFTPGAMIIILPVVFVGIAIATGYVPLDYLR